ncbi:hypothetical protein H2200_005519 [Cladophialophora chaetospira]|uniref:Uncharacterized protein n=1 Tax=Cladophialophora chaetospira TaxID=386627 RepID=A0AA39CJP0_9EURO|nr:hypothetical protein H2200_005519 [Cladophialophora chaetospira]
MADFVHEWSRKETQSKEECDPPEWESHAPRTEDGTRSPPEPAVSRLDTVRDVLIHNILLKSGKLPVPQNNETSTVLQPHRLALLSPMQSLNTHDRQEEILPLRSLSIHPRPKVLGDNTSILVTPLKEMTFGSVSADNNASSAQGIEDANTHLEREGTQSSRQKSDENDLQGDSGADSGDGDSSSLDEFQVASSGEESFMFDSHSPLSFDFETQEDVGVHVSRIAQDLMQEYFSGAGEMVMCTPQSSTESSAPSSSRQMSARASTSSVEQPCSLREAEPRRKRHRAPAEEKEEEGEDEEEGGPNRRRCVGSAKSENPTEDLLACPYAKFDPNRFSERNQDLNEKAYRRCGSA